MRRRTALLALTALAVGGCGAQATEDQVVDSVPADARAYVHLDRESDDWEAAREALGRLPAIQAVVLDLVAGTAVGVPGAGEAGVALLPGQPDAVVYGPDNRPAERSLADQAGYAELLDAMFPQRFVHAYLAAEEVSFLHSLDDSVRDAVAAADVEGDSMRVRARVRHDDEPGRCSSVSGDAELVDVADPAAALYLEVPSIGCAIRFLAGRFDGVGRSLAAFVRAAKREGGVSLRNDLLPLLDRRGALVVAPGADAPQLTLIVDDVDETAALDVLARLQPALIRLLGAEALGQAPTFGAVDVAGVTAATARLAPGLELSYAAWEGRLVVSTALGGIEAVRRGEGLPGTDAFDAVLGDRPSEPAALVFLDLNQLLTLGEQAGLARDPRYLAARDDLQKLRAAGAVVSREEEFTTGELTFQIP